MDRSSGAMLQGKREMADRTFDGVAVHSGGVRLAMFSAKTLISV
jgi:hypothetical protein